MRTKTIIYLNVLKKKLILQKKKIYNSQNI